MAVAAYAAVVSLMHVLDQIQKYPSRNQLHPERKQIETLHQKVSFLQDFLEAYSQIFGKDVADLARQIALVGNEAECAIDSHVVDQLSQISADKSDMSLSCFFQDVDEAIEKIDSIKKKLMLVKEGMMAFQEHQPRVDNNPASSSAPPSGGKNTMVGFDEHLVRIMVELTGYRSDLQIVSIVGLGGIGKTTLARNIFDNPYIVHHFHIRKWFTISQEYRNREILLGRLHSNGVTDDMKNKESSEDLSDLGEQLYKSLSGKRYLIVMDDVWSTKVWEDIKLFFPINRNGSRIMVTTRLSNVAVSLGSHNPYLMNFLDDDESWNLFNEKAFAGEGCPPVLEKTAKGIAKGCKGLPLAIVVIGGMLSNSNMTLEYWEFVAENISSFANLGNDEHCLKILSLSYNHLPIHLKPCFLHMRVFREDDEIRVSKLIKLWVAEGFLKPIEGKCLEEVAKEYLKDLIDRNLILVRKWTRRGKIKTCSIHDLLRDLCDRKSHEHLFCVPKVQETYFTPFGKGCFLCSGPPASTRIYLPQVIAASQATSSISCCFVCDVCILMYPQLHRSRLVRVIRGISGTFYESIESLHPITLRYLSLRVLVGFQFVSTLMPLLWNLQTLIIQRFEGAHPQVYLPSEIWEMPQLRHIMIYNADMPGINKKDSTIVLENLQTLSTIMNFRWSEEVFRRIPNLKKLIISYCSYFFDESMQWYYHSLHYLSHLHKLETLYFDWEWRAITLKKIAFPYSLKKLKLNNCRVLWEDMTIIGSLPNLEVLKLYPNAFRGPERNPIEGEFLRLKLLLIDDCYLTWWRAEKIHFPNLESLILKRMSKLEEIPSSIGEIETLRLIQLVGCTDSVVNSAKEILEEQLNLGNEDLRLHVRTLTGPSII